MKLFFYVAIFVSLSFLYGQQTDSLRTVEVYSKSNISEKASPIPIQIIDSVQLEKMKGATLSQVLETVAGVQINGSDLNFSEPKSLSIRGSRNKSVVLLIDGMPIKDASATDYTLYDLRNIDISQFEQIEILNQSASVLYGSNATVSVINLRRKKDSDTHVSMHFAGGSFNTQNFGTSINIARNHWAIELMGNGIFSNGFSAAEGENFDKDGYQKYNVHTAVKFNNQKWKSQFFIDSDILNYDIDQAAFLDGNGNTKQQNNNVGFQLSREFNKHQLHLLLNANNYRRKLDLDNDKSTDYLYNGKYSELEIRDDYRLHKNLILSLGFQHERQVFNFSGLQYDENFNAHFVEVYGKDSIKQRNNSVFAQLNYTFSKNIGVNVGTRYNYHSVYQSLFNYSIQPYYSKNIKQSEWKFALNIASSFISPTLYQLYGDGSFFLIPNPNLEAEKNQSYSADLSFRNNTFFVFGSVFMRNEKDVFVYDTDANTFVSQYKNLEDNKANGFEVGIEWTAAKWLKINANTSYAKNEKEEAQFRIPKWRSNLALNFNFLKGNSIQIQGQFVGKKTDAYFDNSTFQLVELENEQYLLWSLFMQQRIQKNFELYASIQNLLDSSYVDIIGYTSMPRNIQVGIKCSF